MKTTIPERAGGLPERELLVAREAAGPGVTLYEKELDAYSCVARGDCENIRAAVEELIDEKTARGGLNVKNIDEAKYRATEIINIAARYAAQSGGDEEFCLRLADESVNQIDAVTAREEVYRILIEKIIELTRLVSRSRDESNYPYAIRKSIAYINANLDKNLTVTDVARECRLSPDYLSAYFRRTTGTKMTAYIRRQKMLLARDMLGRHIKCADAALRLSFCSESYFVKCFREEFGITPKKWQNTG